MPFKLIPDSLVLMMMCFVSFSLAQPGQVEKYNIYEIEFSGPKFSVRDNPVRDIDLTTEWQHENGTRLTILGFYDGDGTGGLAGDVFKVRFCPTEIGTWILVKTISNRKELQGQQEGLVIKCTESDRSGFWCVDEKSNGQRWYKRSDGSHPYIVGNTMYTFLSEYDQDGPNGSAIATDVRKNAEYFTKIRFGITGGRYPNPIEKPFLDENSQPTDDGAFSHRPNPRWFSQRVDLAVQTAFGHDLIADIIMNGPDTKANRAILKALQNDGDPSPFLKYMAARYGSYPNVWFCLSNEWDIKKPNYSVQEVIDIGQEFRSYLPYPSPVSIHANQRDWYAEINTEPSWNDHVIIQNKLKTLYAAADVIWRNYWIGDQKPVINDELAYQGDGDGWREEDVIEAMIGAFMGGGYGSTGFKHPKTKQGHYFSGAFSVDEHTAADNLKWMRDIIERDITFWQMAPIHFSYTGHISSSIFQNLEDTFRVMEWPGHEYVLATNAAKKGVQARLPNGSWTVTMYDIINKEKRTLSTSASGRFDFDTPESRAVLFHFKKNN